MCNTYPKVEKINASKIYIDPSERFNGIEKVYPDIDIIDQERLPMGDNPFFEENGVMQCANCGNVGPFKFRHASGKALITIMKNGTLNIELEAACLPIGQVPISDFNDDGEEGLFDILEDFIQSGNCFICLNCGWEMGYEFWNADNCHDCPGCFMCLKGDAEEAVDFCTEEAFAGRCMPGVSCTECKGYYNMIRFKLDPKNIIKSTGILKQGRELMEHTRQMIYEKNNL